MSVVNLEILSGITAIPDNLFRNMNLYYLETLTLPATLETIGDEAFSQVGRSSTAPLDITFPASLKTIGFTAFAGSNINSIDFETGSTLTTIGNNAFTDC